MNQDIARERAFTADGRERCGALAPEDTSRPRCALALGHSGVHQSAETHDGDDWAEAPLPGTERDWLNLPRGVVDQLAAERDSARDRFIRMEGRHEKLKRKSVKRRKGLAKAVGESPKAPMDVLIIMAADQRAYLAKLRAELQHADAERERLTIANAGLNEDIADLEHAYASPRVWPAVAPGGVERVQDHKGDVWFLRHGKWRLGALSYSWGELLDKLGPVTEIVGDS